MGKITAPLEVTVVRPADTTYIFVKKKLHLKSGKRILSPLKRLGMFCAYFGVTYLKCFSLIVFAIAFKFSKYALLLLPLY